ncbi:hypothetical protein HZS_6217 [Henneguya salminicola]|uniref:Palmitoyltransferase n=1 Tax=Henneguya salminicola TaxID=69463 RepID=A0A6G3MFN1_HENSL|nr:hypothetical protein HZS_6217 [Henneguya salminicola]
MMIIVTAIDSIITIYSFIYMVQASLHDPGYYQRAQLNEEGYPNSENHLAYKCLIIKGQSVRIKWCSSCCFYRPPRCSHCSVCDKCVDSFDHHCPWINNCIGLGNYKFFIYFLLFTTIHCCITMSVCIYVAVMATNNMNLRIQRY